MPMGSKKRRAAKKRKGEPSLAVQTGADSSEAAIPTTATATKGNGREIMEEKANGSESPDDGVDGGEEHKQEDGADSDSSSASSSSAAVPIPENSALEEVESGDRGSGLPADDEGGRSGDVAEPSADVLTEEVETVPLDGVEPIAPEERVASVPLDDVEPVAPEERVASVPVESVSAQGGAVPIEAVETLSLVEAAPEVEEKSGSLSVEGLPVSSERRQEETESREIENEVQGEVSPQLARRTSWLSCCGLFEAFRGSNG